MKIKRKFSYFILLMLVIFISAHTIQSEENGKGITIGYEANREIEMHEMKVVVVGDGYISDNGFIIRDYVMNYQLKDGDTKTFKIHANKQSVLKSVVFNSEDITASVDFKNEIKVMAKKYNTVLVVTFDSKGIEPIKPIPPIPPKPVLPSVPNVEKPVEKEIITIIVKDILLKDIDGVIDDEFLRKYIISSSEYKILSHNVLKKEGTYEIVVQLLDGSVKVLEINVIEDREGKNVVAHENERCNIHLMILFLFMLFIIYGIYIYYQNYKKIMMIEKYGMPQIMNTKKTGNRAYLITALVLQIVITALFLLNECSFDLFAYLFSSIGIIILVVISQLQERSYLEVLNYYK